LFACGAPRGLFGELLARLLGKRKSNGPLAHIGSEWNEVENGSSRYACE
jgi:hypothetical protein